MREGRGGGVVGQRIILYECMFVAWANVSLMLVLLRAYCVGVALRGLSSVL